VDEIYIFSVCRKFSFYIFFRVFSFYFATPRAPPSITSLARSMATPGGRSRRFKFPETPLLRNKPGVKPPACPGFSPAIDAIDVSTGGSYDHKELLRFPCSYTTLKGCCKRTACRDNISKYAKLESWEDHVKMYTEDGNFVNIERSAAMLREHMAVAMTRSRKALFNSTEVSFSPPKKQAFQNLAMMSFLRRLPLRECR
jgi:hypothetical protein